MRIKSYFCNQDPVFQECKNKSIFRKSIHFIHHIDGMKEKKYINTENEVMAARGRGLREG